MRVLFLGLCVATLAWAQNVPSLSSIQGQIAARTASESKLWYLRLEVQRDGEAQMFDVPDAEYGQAYRQVNVEEWWTDGEKYAMALRFESESYLDGKLVSSMPSSDVPRFVYSFDGSDVYHIDFQYPGGKLTTHAEWPFTNAAVAITFGRAFSMRHYGDVISNARPAMRQERYRGNECSVIDWNSGRLRTEAWLSKELGFLCVKEVAYVNGRVAADRVFQFKSDSDGFRHPSDAVERFVRSNGEECITSWHVVEYKKKPVLPPYLFTPDSKDMALVIDGMTGNVIKSESGK